MIVPRELLSSVVFIGVREPGGERLGGTGYFASVPLASNPARHHIYLVTARHCVDGRTSLIARVNATADSGGGTKSVDLPDGDDKKWFRHTSPGPGEDFVDLVATRWPDPDGAFAAGYRWVPQSMYFDEALFGDNPMSGAGLADEVITIGLLTVHYGTTRNAPVVRVGNLALIPDEPVLVTYQGGLQRRMRLYLTELRSISGLSGSPVFLRHRQAIGEPMAQLSLLGTMIGHWDDGDRNHMGFGKVVPSQLLAEVLNQKDAMTERENVERNEPGPVAVEDTAISEFSRFQDLTKKLVNVPKKELDEKRVEEGG
jgi:hypothetical protein